MSRPVGSVSRVTFPGPWATLWYALSECRVKTQNNERAAKSKKRRKTLVPVAASNRANRVPFNTGGASDQS